MQYKSPQKPVFLLPLQDTQPEPSHIKFWNSVLLIYGNNLSIPEFELSRFEILFCQWSKAFTSSVWFKVQDEWLLVSHRMAQAALRMGRLAGSRAYWFLKLCFLLLSTGPAFFWLPAGGELSCELAEAFSALPPLLFFIFLTFSLSWGSLVTTVESVAPSNGGSVSGGRSVGVGFPSACSSLGMFRLELECLVLVQVELPTKQTPMRRKEKGNSHVHW